jgi:hypothetical protein
VATIDGSATPEGKFVSLHDASIDIDRVSGHVYVVDNLQPKYTERPGAIVYVFDAAGNYLGHLIDKVNDALPVGLAVDNSASPTYPAGKQGLVYVTSGNTASAAIYNYTPGAETTQEPEPVAFGLKLNVLGNGGGTIRSSTGTQDCGSSCEESVPAGSTVVLSATPDTDSSFVGWSGACAGSQRSCTLELDETASVHARFEPSQQATEGVGGATVSASTEPGQTAAPPRVHRKRHHHHRRHRSAHRRGHADGNT